MKPSFRKESQGKSDVLLQQFVSQYFRLRKAIWKIRSRNEVDRIFY